MAMAHKDTGHPVLLQNPVSLIGGQRRAEISQSIIDCVGKPVEENVLL
jgi:hypothetical protein